MRTDKDTGAPQFTDADLLALGEIIQDDDNPKGLIRTYLLDLDGLNMWLRVYAIKEKKKRGTKRKNSRPRT